MLMLHGNKAKPGSLLQRVFQCICSAGYHRQMEEIHALKKHLPKPVFNSLWFSDAKQHSDMPHYRLML